jgi:hypothetical protein
MLLIMESLMPSPDVFNYQCLKDTMCKYTGKYASAYGYALSQIMFFLLVYHLCMG